MIFREVQNEINYLVTLILGVGTSVVQGTRFLVADDDNRLKNLYEMLKNRTNTFPDVETYYMSPETDLADIINDANTPNIINFVVVCSFENNNEPLYKILNTLSLAIVRNNRFQARRADTWVKLTLVTVYDEKSQFKEKALSLAGMLKENAGSDDSDCFPNTLVVHSIVRDYSDIYINELCSELLLLTSVPKREVLGPLMDERFTPGALFSNEDYPWAGYEVYESHLPELILLRHLVRRIEEDSFGRSFDEGSYRCIQDDLKRKIGIDDNTKAGNILSRCSEFIPIEITEEKWKKGCYVYVTSRGSAEKSKFFVSKFKRNTKEKEIPYIEMPGNSMDNFRTSNDIYREYILSECSEKQFLELLFHNMPFVRQVTDANVQQFRRELYETAARVLEFNDINEIFNNTGIKHLYLNHINNVGDDVIIGLNEAFRKAYTFFITQLRIQVNRYSAVLNTDVAISHAIEERIIYFSLDSEEMNKRLYDYIDDKIRNDKGFMDMLRNTWNMIQLPPTIIAGNVDRLYTPEHKHNIDQKYAVVQGDTVAGYKWTVRNDDLKKIVLMLRYDCEDHNVMIDPIA